jgi:hypothetical protein
MLFQTTNAVLADLPPVNISISSKKLENSPLIDFKDMMAGEEATDG